MDFRFYYNDRQLPCARLSMDHEAFGLWLSDELSDDSDKLAEVIAATRQIIEGQQAEYEWRGRDFLLRITEDDAEVIALELLQEHSLEELEDEDMDFYDAESRAMCGPEDFLDLLIEWRDFLEE